MDLSDLQRQFEVPPPDAFGLAPEEAIDYWRRKGRRPTFSYQDMLDREHEIAFTVAKMQQVDLLADVQESLDQAIASGQSFQAWARELEPRLRQAGWWGRRTVTDPATGAQVEAQLGSRARLETIFRTNVQTAYARGHWQQIESQAEEAPYLMYDAIDDGRTRPAHRAWDGLVLKVTDRWWRTHTPPCGYNCRCSVTQLDRDDLESLGLEESEAPATQFRTFENPRTGETERIAAGVDRGFGRAASDTIDRLNELLGEKINRLPRAMRADARQAMDQGPAPQLPE